MSMRVCSHGSPLLPTLTSNCDALLFFPHFCVAVLSISPPFSHLSFSPFRPRFYDTVGAMPASTSTSSTAPQQSQMITLIDIDEFDRAYRVDHMLGKGGFGTVYSGVRLRDGLPVAIKHINKNSVNAWSHVSEASTSNAPPCRPCA